jgi:chromosome segregation ATPase
MDSWYQGEIERWDTEHAEIKKRIQTLEQLDNQYKHELRRKDAEIERLKGRLLEKITSRSSTAGSVGMRQSSASGSRSSSSGGSSSGRYASE